MTFPRTYPLLGSIRSSSGDVSVATPSDTASFSPKIGQHSGITMSASSRSNAKPFCFALVLARPNIYRSGFLRRETRWCNLEYSLDAAWASGSFRIRSRFFCSHFLCFALRLACASSLIQCSVPFLRYPRKIIPSARFVPIFIKPLGAQLKRWHHNRSPKESPWTAYFPGSPACCISLAGSSFCWTSWYGVRIDGPRTRAAQGLGQAARGCHPPSRDARVSASHQEQGQAPDQGTPPMSSNSWRRCSGCSKDRLTDGGCELSPLKWLCAACWGRFIRRKFKS